MIVVAALGGGLQHLPKGRRGADQDQSASVIGSVYRLEVGYPAYCSNGEQEIVGELVQIKNQDLLWPLLDQFFAYKKDSVGRLVLPKYKEWLQKNHFVSTRQHFLSWIDQVHWK